MSPVWSRPRARRIPRVRATVWLAVPAVATLLERLAARGESLRFHIPRFLALLDDYGPQELAAAIAAALLGAGAIAHILETRRRQRGLKPPIPIAARSPWRPRSRRHAAPLGDLR